MNTSYFEGIGGKIRYYRHFKGGKYRLLGIGKDSETLEPVVVYQALYGERGIWVRPYDMFFGRLVRDGVEYQRFTEISEEEALGEDEVARILGIQDKVVK